MNNTCACIRITTTAACPQANPSIGSSAVKQSGERGEGGNVTPPMGGQGRAKGGSEPNEIGGYLRTDPAPKPAVEGSRCVYIERLSPRKDDASGPHLGQINLCWLLYFVVSETETHLLSTALILSLSLSLLAAISVRLPELILNNDMVQSKKFRGVRQRHWGSWVSEIRHPLL
ncbi:hypothetical protein GW17_00004053 [Ensete ventricosum]|nr:hypothetical protein GW17_00004053 [Ensete ventricosum]RZR94089.1 hypothetical protein BHM03_00022709 [Ensete ventricosum]